MPLSSTPTPQHEFPPQEYLLPTKTHGGPRQKGDAWQARWHHKMQDASSENTRRCRKGCPPFVQHILAYSSRLTQLWLQRACCLLFFPQPISLPWLALEFVQFSYQVTVSHLQLWVEKLWTAFCIAGLEHRDNSTWSAEPRGDTREVALQLPGGLVLVATELQSP